MKTGPVNGFGGEGAAPRPGACAFKKMAAATTPKSVARTFMSTSIGARVGGGLYAGCLAWSSQLRSLARRCVVVSWPRRGGHMVRETIALSVWAMLCSSLLIAQAPATPPAQPAAEPWRFAGTRPCIRPEGGILKCSSPPHLVAIRAGRLFDSVTGQLRTRQVVIVQGERIT